MYITLQSTLNGHPYKIDTSIIRKPGVGPAPVIFQSFSVTKLPIRLIPLLNGQLEPVPTLSVLERVYCNLKNTWYI